MFVQCFCLYMGGVGKVKAVNIAHKSHRTM